MLANEVTKNWTRESAKCYRYNLVCVACPNYKLICNKTGSIIKKVTIELFKKHGKPNERLLKKIDEE